MKIKQYNKGGKMCSCGKMPAGKCNCGKDESYGVGGKMKYKKGGKFPDLTGDGKVTMADVLKGRGVGMKKPSRSEKRQMRKQDRITKREQKRFEKKSKIRTRRGN